MSGHPLWVDYGPRDRHRSANRCLSEDESRAGFVGVPKESHCALETGIATFKVMSSTKTLHAAESPKQKGLFDDRQSRRRNYDSAS